MEAKNTHGLTALQVVCNNQDVEMVTTLLRAGCQVNAKSSVTGIYLFLHSDYIIYTIHLNFKVPQ